MLRFRGFVMRPEPGDVVRVRTEPILSEVVAPAHHKLGCTPDDGPEVLVCCVPVALVRTPVGTGVLRWIELRDLTSAGENGGTPGSAGMTPA